MIKLTAHGFQTATDDESENKSADNNVKRKKI